MHGKSCGFREMHRKQTLRITCEIARGQPDGALIHEDFIHKLLLMWPLLWFSPREWVKKHELTFIYISIASTMSILIIFPCGRKEHRLVSHSPNVGASLQNSQTLSKVLRMHGIFVYIFFFKFFIAEQTRMHPKLNKTRRLCIWYF